MNINRNNYEEYFLLYADNELCEQGKNEVEIFVQKNPDLEEELVMLLQAVLKPDHSVVLNNKAFLNKQETSLYEEQFILYHDNELNLSEKGEVEETIKNDAVLKREFELLQQLYLKPDTSIVFPGKRFLYKREKPGKVIPVSWGKLAAASVLAGFTVWGVSIYLLKDKPEQAIAVKVSEPENKSGVNLPSQQENVPENKNDTSILTPEKRLTSTGTAVPKKTKESVNNFAVNTSQTLSKTSENITKVAEKEAEEVAINEPGKIQIKPTNDFSKITPADISDKPFTASSLLPNTVQPVDFVNEEEPQSENYVFFNVTQEEFRKSKMGIFLKKVKRIIERRNPLKEKTFKVSSIQVTTEN